MDRYGQPSPEVKAITYYGYDNGIDGIVLDVLIRKHQTIRNSLGVSVPVPVDTHQVVEAILEGLLLAPSGNRGQGKRKNPAGRPPTGAVGVRQKRRAIPRGTPFAAGCVGGVCLFAGGLNR